MIKEYQTLIGLLAIALSIYLGLTTSHGNIVNMSAKTDLDSCMEYTLELSNTIELEAWKLCLQAYAND